LLLDDPQDSTLPATPIVDIFNNIQKEVNHPDTLIMSKEQKLIPAHYFAIRAPTLKPFITNQANINRRFLGPHP
jgi:hypothetical protein